MENQLITLEFLKQRPLSYSSLKQFGGQGGNEVSPENYVHYITQPKKEPSPAMILGSMVDCLILTPDDFDNKFLCLPKLDLRTTAGKEKYAEIMKVKGDKTLVNPNDYEIAKKIKQKLYAHDNAMKMLKRISQTQKEVRWTDEETGLPLIKKIDGYGDKSIIELKTAKNSSPNTFSKDAFNMDYPLQAGIYMEGEKKSFFYIVVETEEPFGISVLKPHEEYIEFGQKQLRHLLREFKYCLDNNLFDRGYDYRLERNFDFLNLPAWAQKNKPQIIEE